MNNRSYYRILPTQVRRYNIDAHILGKTLGNLFFIVATDVYFLLGFFGQDLFDESVAEICEWTCVDCEEFVLAFCAVSFAVFDVLFGDCPFEVLLTNSLNISNNIDLSDMPPHLLGNINFQKVHIIETILVPVHLINQNIFGNIKYDGSALIILAKIVKNATFMKILKILPLILSPHHLIPLQILFDIFSGLVEVEIAGD